ncbi:hypothetical protein [Alloactinosynnema sp. L-07]|nr:hypothetical protein [Alloactinosynnema sp. L-07]
MNASLTGLMSEARRRAPASPIGVHSGAQCSSVSTSIRSRRDTRGGHGAVAVSQARATRRAVAAR